MAFKTQMMLIMVSAAYRGIWNLRPFSKVNKVRKSDHLYSALRKHLQCAQEWHVLTWDHTVLSASHTLIHDWNKPSYLYSISIHQMSMLERGSTYIHTYIRVICIAHINSEESLCASSTHPITAYYSFIDLGRMKG